MVEMEMIHLFLAWHLCMWIPNISLTTSSLPKGLHSIWNPRIGIPGYNGLTVQYSKPWFHHLQPEESVSSNDLTGGWKNCFP